MTNTEMADWGNEDDVVRTRILAEPALILDDPELMRALVAASDNTLGDNVVDLRGMAMDRLEARLAQLDETHRTVIAVASENRASTDQIHRAALRLLEGDSFEESLRVLGTEIAEILRLDSLRLVLESAQTRPDPALARLGDVVHVAAPGSIETYMTAGRGPVARRVVLRAAVPGAGVVHGVPEGLIGSEALMRLDLGAGRLPGMLAMGSADPEQFKPGQGTDLLTFFADVLERAMRRWLA